MEHAQPISPSIPTSLPNLGHPLTVIVLENSERCGWETNGEGKFEREDGVSSVSSAVITDFVSSRYLSSNLDATIAF
ncbi:hypothetical protein HNY73_014818 [Argiope bruennichi]|uniref:Uncharacterized protein n=1 Tax=Argiope bruennichi TaxID=94029 RepID=A0A8T0EQJ1_ARGBR|nr:hypothetical protein HNY73_014818 [Argiope bruennichi]